MLANNERIYFQVKSMAVIQKSQTTLEYEIYLKELWALTHMSLC